MLIHYKGIVHERMSDAPFVGALILANDCSHNCPGCFNQYLKQKPTIVQGYISIIKEVQRNKYNEGIILGGLEWTEQPLELTMLALVAKFYKLQVMIYTHMTQEEFTNAFPTLVNKGIWFKFGEYREGTKSTISSDIRLASDNQEVVYLA